jgi:hypothetical protein
MPQVTLATPDAPPKEKPMKPRRGPSIPPPEDQHGPLMNRFLFLSPVVVVVLLAAVLALGKRVQRAEGFPPRAQPEEQLVPVQEMTAIPDAGPVLRSALGKLPKGDPRQRRAPCDPDMEVEMAVDGDRLCWIPLDVPKCPENKAIKHNGKCYLRALNAERPPTSGGERRPGGVADP